MCIIIISLCFNFISTANGEDYVPVNGHIIQFNRGDITQNLTIRINDDNECEDDKNENFFCNLTLVSRISDINVKIHQASVSIDDYNEGECVPTLLPQPYSTSYYKTLTTGNSGSETMSPTDSPNDAQTSTATVITAGVVVVAVVLIIAIAVVIVSIAALVLRNYQQKNSLKNAANM